MFKSIKDLVDPVPEKLLEGKDEKEKNDISRGFRSLTRLKEQESVLATNAYLQVAPSEHKTLKTIRRVPSQPEKKIVKVTVPRPLQVFRSGKASGEVASALISTSVKKESATSPGPKSGIATALSASADTTVGLSSHSSSIVVKNSSPSERIGVFYTPTANIRTTQRNEIMQSYEYQISYRNIDPPPPLPPTLKPEDKGVFGKDPTMSHFIPITEFDNIEYESHTPEEWVMLGAADGGTPAKSRYYTEDDEEVWAPCKVVGYDSVTKNFTITWNHKPNAFKSTSRLNLIFDAEDEEMWKRRVSEAMRIRDEAEAKVRLHLYVGVGDTSITPVNEDQVDNILALVATEFPLLHLNVIEQCIGEMREVYKFGLARAVHDYKYRSQAEIVRLEPLNLPSVIPPHIDSLNTLLATIDTPSPNFVAAKEFIKVNLFHTHAMLYPTIQAVHARWAQFETGLLCDTIMKGVTLPCELHVFEEMQTRTGSFVSERLREDWSNSVSTTIQNNLDTHFSFYEENFERYKASRMYRFFRMINTMMSSQLRHLLVDSIEHYCKFLCSFDIVLPEDFSPEADVVVELEEDVREREHWEKIAQELIAFCIREHEEKKAAKASQKKRGKEARKEEEEEEAPPPEFKAEDVLQFPYVRNASPYSARIVNITQNPNGLEPLFAVKLISNSDCVRFSPLLEELEDKVKNIFDGFFIFTDNIRGIEDQLFPLLGLPQVLLKPLERNDPFVENTKKTIHSLLMRNMEGPLQLQEMYRTFEYLLKIDIDTFDDAFANRNPSLRDFDVTLERINRDIDRITYRTLNEVKFELIKVECESIKNSLHIKARSISKAILELLARRCDEGTRRLSAHYARIFKRIGMEPKKPEELQELKEFIDGVGDQLNRLSDEYQLCIDSVALLHKYRFITNTEDFNGYWEVFEWPKKVHQQLEDSEFKCKEYRNAFQQELHDNCEKLNENITVLSNRVESMALDTDEKYMDEYYAKVLAIKQKIEQHENEITIYNHHEVIFGLPTSQWQHIRDIKSQFIPYYDLWETMHFFSIKSDLWMTSSLVSDANEMDAKLIEQQLTQWRAKVNSVIKKLKGEGPLEVAKHLKDSLDRFLPNIPLIAALRSNLQLTHWKQIFQLVGVVDKNISPDNYRSKNLHDFLNMEMLKHITQIEEIAETATMTHNLESDLSQMETDWKKLVFELEPLGQTYKLKSCDVVQQTLDEHIMKTQSLLGKPIIRQGLAPSVVVKAQNWARILDNIQCTTDEWYKCQANWAYLEPIFSSADISKSLPVEASKFSSINSSWIRIMETTRSNPPVISRCMDESLLKDLTEHNKTLEEILKKLHAFLETKRMAFPRFYFISNEELLQILSDTRDPYLVQPYLSKCFEGIKRIKFLDNLDIVAMESAEQEVVPFSKKVNPADHNNAVEIWLQSVETVMAESIRDQLQKARDDYAVRNRIEFIRHWPGQVVIAICSLFWTSEASDAMMADGAQGLQMYYEKCNTQLDDLIVLVRDRDLKPVERATLEALVVIEVHGRDIILELAEKGVENLNDFDWLAQLRYYWTSDNHFDVCQINAELRYGYEYLGNTGRLVITQLTDRCYRTLMGALHLNYGGAPEGPAGTGKTETTKDLAKALGKYCVVYNCTDQITAKDMAKLFKGLSQSGSWGCFDEFNRIEIQVLSVIAQQIATIQDAIVQKKLEYIFEGTQIKLKIGCAVFITMNPGYAGRAELPDNLKALFRPVAMMVPNYAMIGQIQLFSYGFLHGKVLAEKIVATYRLCSEQLSSQDHYDYGMRAVKAVLTAAGRLKRLFPDEDESILMLRSIQDVNLPKFLAQDVELFRGIVSDLFPGVMLPTPDYNTLSNALDEVCAETNLQPTDYFKEKCFQTYEMIIVRHGMMIVGFSFGGKTRVLQSLSGALTVMNHTKLEEKTHLITINPKSITMGQLYGKVDPSGEWTDGILSKNFRTVAADTTPDRKWLVLDGPVDAVWIENMNTVLDDNKKLCLQNGDIIPMSKQMNMIFEVQDLVHASPATVSRCGMVYVEPEALGWRPLIMSYRNVLPNFIKDNENTILLFDTLVEWILPPILEVVRKLCTCAIPQGASVAIMSFIKLFGALMKPYDAEDESVEEPIQVEDKELLLIIEGNFLFATTWAVGGALYIKDRDTFNSHLLEIINNEKNNRLSVPLPDKKTFYDGRYIVVEKEMRFVDWLDTLGEFSIPAEAEYQSVIVPTADTAKYKYLLQVFISAMCPPLLVGDTGTGKTIMAKSLLNGYSKEQYSLNIIQFSAQTSCNDAQRLIDNKCERRRKGVYGPQPNKKMLIFIDDVNMPALEEYGAQPPIELLRQWLDHGGWYNHTKDNVDFREIEDVLFLSAMGPPGGGRNPVTQRFTRHFNTVAVPAFDEATLTKIFGSLMEWIFCKGYAQAMRNLSPMVVSATCELYDILVKKLKPTPEKSHYTFNLRDVSKVFQGISMASAAKVQDPVKLYRLWTHEVNRAFADRFVEQRDTEWFITQLGELMSKHFKVQYKTVCPGDGGIVFADFMNDREIYEEVEDMKDARRILEDKLDVFNSMSRTGPMDLVIFNYVIEHVARINRILKQPSGNALLIGVGGSGRHSCTKLASHCLGYEYTTIAVTKAYKRNDFHDDIRNVLVKAGQNGMSIIFCLSDTQIIDDTFLEDVSNLLNTGEVIGLFDSKQDQDTLEQVITALKDVASRDATKEDLIALFIDRCKKYLHIVLCFSPVGSTLRERLRQFPSLVNCTTIDWFRQWPTDGLESVATRFLAEMDLSDELRVSIRECFVTYHQDVRQLGEVYLEEALQHTYVTPTSYLELLKAFKNLLSSKRTELLNLRMRYDRGLDQLKKTEADVAVMKEELAVMLPQLERKAKETAELISIVEKESREAGEIREKVAVEEEAANKTAERAKNIKDISQAKVDEAQPKLEAAKKSAENLDNAALAEVKQTKKVMEGSVVTTVIEGLCKMLGGQYKPKPVRDPLTGKITYNYFEHAIRTLLTTNFKSTLTNFANDMENCATDEDMAAVEKMLNLPSFEDKAVARASVALLGISSYIRNMVDYFNMNKVVKPLLAEAAAAQKEYDIAMSDLSVKKEELRLINEQLAAKQEQLERVTAEKESLENKVTDTQTKIERAVKLIEGLGGEKARYVTESERYAQAYQNVVGDVVLSAGMVAYLGPFQSKYRQNTLNKWTQMCKDKSIPCSSNFVFEKFLGDPIAIQNWKLQQLPSDTFSVDNAIMIMNALCYPLLIDPQQQANKWIRNMEHPNGLVVVRPAEPGYTRKIANCVRDGLPCLLENIDEDLDPVLENLLLKRLVREGSGLSVVIDESVEWNPKFRLYITTKLPRPHYQPEVSTKVALINFMITQGGLQDQLLQKVMMSERKEVEERKQAMTIEAAANKTSLKATEDTILRLLSSSGSLLENESAILELDRSKVQSDKVSARQQDIEAMEKISDRTRQLFVPVARVGAQLFFCVAELANIDPMYQYSLQFYITLFQSALLDSAKAEDVQERIENIVSTFQYSLYTRICHSLFARDQLLFSFIMCIKLFDANPVDVRWLLMGGFERDAALTPNPCKDWLPDLNWKSIWRASTQLPALMSIAKTIAAEQERVKAFYESTEPFRTKLPPALQDLKDIHRLILVRCLRPDKMVPAVTSYVESKLGQKFVEPPLFNLEQITEELMRTPSVAVIFVLSPGADPNAELDRVAELKGMSGKRLTKLSLGQGQDAPAKEMITEGKRTGNWVLLQNCHLYRDFMPELAAIIEDYSRYDVKDTLHKDFRLWLTSLPSEEFPVSILQNGVKLVQEPPKGLKSNLLRSYMSDPIADPKFFEGCNKPEQFKKLLFGLTFFHSLVQERRKFGPLGWNRPYEFNDTDMRISVKQLHMFIDENDEIPYDALSYLVGQCNYGGRVTDDWDRRCLVATLAIFFTPDILIDDYHFSSDSPEYYAPSGDSHASFVAYIQSLPMNQKPGIFGLHSNADITKDERDAKVLLDATLATQPRESSGDNAVLDPKHVVFEMAKEVHERLPKLFDTEDVIKKYPITYSQSMNTVLLQELIRYNRLLVIARLSLFELQKAIHGEIVMSAELEQVFNSVYDGKVPNLWHKRSYPSLKSFGAYINDFLERLSFLQKWIDNGPPPVFWVSGFFFTQSFFTGIMQNYARKYNIEIDKLVWDFTIMGSEAITKSPDDGCYINGLFLEGAGWNSELGFLCESKPKELYISFPTLYLKPVKQDDATDISHYKCPTYKTTDRCGVLSTTGHSTNFIMVINLPRRENDLEDHWVLRGTALFTQLEY